MWQEGKTFDELSEIVRDDVRIQTQDSTVLVHFTSCRTNAGLGALSQDIFAHLDSARRERWARTAQSYSVEFLEEKRRSCERYVLVASGAALANALNPVPGVDVAVDLGILTGLFSSIRASYGLTTERLGAAAAMGAAEPVVREIVEYASKEGILLLLKRFAGRTAVKQFAKYIPFVGQIIAGSIGFGITYGAGNHYLQDCHDVARSILERELNSTRT